MKRVLTDEQRQAAKERMARWLESNLEHKREWDRRYAAENREKAAAKARAWYRANTERAKANVIARRLSQPEVVREEKRNYKARKKGAEGSHTAADIRQIRLAQNNCCAYCREKLGRHGHLDHIVPLKLGGSNWPRNLQWLCAPCNLTKRAKDPLTHARNLGLLL
jgi:5-methylcytosine-specific restriction endonuclease McrA